MAGLSIIPVDPEETRGTPQGYLITTSYAPVSLDIEQTLLDDIKTYVNQACSLLTSFRGIGGTFNLNWLDQLKDKRVASNGTQGLYCLLHNPASSPCSNAANDPSQGGGALLDTMALNALQGMQAQSLALQLNVSPALLAAWTASLPNSPQASQPLTPCEWAAVRDAYVEQKLGNIAIPYTNSISGTALGLLNWTVSDIAFLIDLFGAPLITDLTISGSNQFTCTLSLPDISGPARFTSSPTAQYFIGLEIGAIACAEFHVGCVLVQEAEEVALFLGLNIASIEIDCTHPTITTTVSLQPDNLLVLRPEVNVAFSPKPTVTITTGTPPFLNTIVFAIISVVLSNANLIQDHVRTSLQKAIQQIIDQANLRFPLAEGPIQDLFQDSAASGLASNYLDAVSEPAIIMSQNNQSEQIIRAEDQLPFRFRDLILHPPNPNLAFPKTVNILFQCHLYGGLGDLAELPQSAA